MLVKVFTYRNQVNSVEIIMRLLFEGSFEVKERIVNLLLNVFKDSDLFEE